MNKELLLVTSSIFVFLSTFMIINIVKDCIIGVNRKKSNLFIMILMLMIQSLLLMFYIDFILLYFNVFNSIHFFVVYVINSIEFFSSSIQFFFSLILSITVILNSIKNKFNQVFLYVFCIIILVLIIIYIRYIINMNHLIIKHTA